MARKPIVSAKIEEENRRAIVYCRVSTSEQVDSGLGLEAQQRRCIGYCEAQGWAVAGTYTDAGISAKTLERPELERALAALSPGSVLVVLKLDRLTRTVADLAPLAKRIEEAKAEWASVQEKFDTSSATGRLMLRMMLELSQWEREVIGERTAAALGQKKARGERLGGTPLGYRTSEDGSVTIDKEGTRVVKLIRALKRKGLSLRAIVAELEKQDIAPMRGKKWYPGTVAYMLKPRYLESSLVVAEQSKKENFNGKVY